MERFDLLSEINRVVGISIGSLIGLLWCLNYSPDEILLFFCETDIRDVLGSITLEGIREGKGLIPITFLQEGLKKKVLDKLGFVPSMSQMYSLTKRNFVAIATEENSEEPVFIDETTFPDLPVVDAVLMSTNIPIFFHQIMYQGKVYSDGASTAPYPVDFYQDVPLLGMVIFTDVEQGTTSGRIRKVLQTSVNRLIRLSIERCSGSCRNLILKTKYSDTTGISMTTEDKLFLFKDGFEQVFNQIQECVSEI